MEVMNNAYKVNYEPLLSLLDDLFLPIWLDLVLALLPQSYGFD
jgi:hypothetical protein